MQVAFVMVLQRPRNHGTVACCPVHEVTTKRRDQKHNSQAMVKKRKLTKLNNITVGVCYLLVGVYTLEKLDI